jgi:RIO kinase 2
VSSAEKAALMLTELENYDLRILQAIELGMITHETVPFEEIVKYSGLNEDELEYRLGKLDRLELIWRQHEPYLGYIINYTAYDLLALNALVKGEVLEALGSSVGVGKEADVYEGFTPDKTRVAIKFHRLGRTSFRDTRRKREYLADRRHISWLYQSRLAAENEYKALQLMFEAGVNVPKPISQNRHTIVMSYIEGHQLSDVAFLDVPEEFLDDIIKNIRIAYKAGVVHSDLSEYNVLVDNEAEVWIIDWPQYITIDHPNSKETLERDIRNIVYYFQRKFNSKRSIDDAISYVEGG